jgi:glycosyltransferase involved in cell wall biosynthesis
MDEERETAMRKWMMPVLTATAGLLAGGGASLPAGWSQLAVDLPLGLLLGAGLGLSVRAVRARPLATLGTLLLLSLLAASIGDATGASGLGSAALLLCVPPLLLLARDPVARRAARWNVLTAAAVAYSVLIAVRLAASPDGQLPVHLGDMLAPVAFFFAGMCVPARSGPEGETAGRQRSYAIERLGWAAGAGLLVVGLVVVLPLLLTGSTPAGAGAAMLADTLALLVVLGLTWDTRRRFWLALFGGVPWPARMALGVAVLAAGGLAVLGLGRFASSGQALALGATLLALYALRRRLTELALLGVAAFAALRLDPLHASGWPTVPSPAPAGMPDGGAWTAALTSASASPLGTGISGPAGGAGSLYLATLRQLGTPGLTTLFVLLAVALTLCLRGYRLLRPTSGEAGGLLAAMGIVLYIAFAGLTASPLREPVPAALFWLFLGLANGSADTLTLPAEARGELDESHGQPLRVAYVAYGTHQNETAAALLDYLRAFDRQRVTPLLLVRAEGPLVAAARGLALTVRVTPRHDPEVSYSAIWLARRGPRLRRLGGTSAGAWCLVLADDLRHTWETLAEWAAMARDTLELRPDLLVSTAPELHVPALLLGRLAAVPVQWQARVAAPASLRPALNVLALWTAGVLVGSQAQARTFSLRLLGSRVRVLRPSIVLPVPAEPERLLALRRELRLAPDTLTLTAVMPVTAESAHQDLLDATMLLLARYPQVRVLLASEALPGQGERADVTDTLERVTRLRGTIAMSGLESVITYLGARQDVADLLAASDVAVLPYRRANVSRGLLLALAQGVPIVSTRLPAIEEQLAEAWGYELAEPFDPTALAESIGRVLARLEQHRADARRNPGLVRDWYAAAVELGRLYPIYRDICLPEPPRWPRPQRRAASVPLGWLAALRAADGSA